MRAASIRQVALLFLWSVAFPLGLGCGVQDPPIKKDAGRDLGKTFDGRFDTKDGTTDEKQPDVPFKLDTSQLETTVDTSQGTGGTVAKDALPAKDVLDASGGKPATGGAVVTGGVIQNGGSPLDSSLGTGGIVATGGTQTKDASTGFDISFVETSPPDTSVPICLESSLCDDGNACTVDDLCLNGTCTGTSNEGAACDSGKKFCHDKICQAGCFIDGSFIAAEGINSNNECQVCDPSKSMARWSLASTSKCRPTALTAGGDHTCAIVYGGAWCWGQNTSGELGNGKLQNSSQPVQVKGLTSGVTAIAAGLHHTCAIVSGNVWCWGDNSKGQLGNGLSMIGIHTEPLQVPGLAPGIKIIASGDTHSCAAMNRGAMCWGYDGSLPMAIDSFANVTVVGLAAATDFTCAVGPDTPNPNSEGQLYYWENKERVAGDLPMMEWLTGTAVFAAGNRGCAIHQDDFRLRCWSYDSWTHSDVFSAGVSTAALSPTHGCAIVTGQAQCWGSNTHGQLGNGRTLNSRTPVMAVELSANVTAIAVGMEHSCAMVEGDIRCWGANANGQLGNGTVEESHTPSTPIHFLF